MSTQVQRRKGTTVQHATFTGASAELTVDTTKNTVVVHDGATAGGIPLAKETGSAISVTSFASSGSATIETTDNTNAALRITQLGTGNALLVEDSANPDSSPFVIDTAGRVAIGHTSTVAGTGPSSSTRPSLQVHGLSNSTSGTGVYNWSSTASLTSAVTFNRSLSNTIGTFGGAVTSGTSLGALSFSGDDGVSFYEAARIQAQADATATVGSTPGRLTFSTTPTGTTAVVERLRIASNGDISIAGGTANGITYLNGSKVLTSGTALTFDGTNLGIGTTSPAYKVDVSGSVRISSKLLLDTGAAALPSLTFSGWVDTGIYNPTGTSLGFSTSGAEKMRLDASGNLGIGTTSPGYRLDTDGSAVRFTRSSKYLIVNPNYNAANTNVDLEISSGMALTFSIGGGVEKMRLDSSGNLGIGTTSPGWKLTVAGTDMAVTDAGGGSNTIVSALSGLSRIRSNTSLAFDTGASYTERMRLDASGNLLVGTTTAGTSAAKVIGMGNATAPTTSPAGMGQLYVEGGALKFRGSSGTVTTIAPA